MANNVIRPVKGTRDFYPEAMGLRSWLYQQMRIVSESFGYQEYEGPILERFELYAAKSGEEIVEKQSYVFEDRAGEKITLRPELTPTLARMVATKQGQLTFPLRWWSFGPFWRYERPQKGRSREFFQWNIDMIGDASPEADAELVSIAAAFLKQVGLKPEEAQILVNNRKLIDQQTEKLGIAKEDRGKVYRWIDRKDKMKPDAWLEEGKNINLNGTQIQGVESLLDDKDAWKSSEEMQRFFKVIEAYGLAEYVQYAPHIIRGLLYYTGTVFEAWDTSGEFRSIFGGGRYDNLIGDVGGQDISAVGFAAGDTVIALLLKKLGHLPEFGHTPADVYITLFDEESRPNTLQLAHELRDAGIKVTSHLKADKLGKQFKYADRIGARIALVLGPDEIAQENIAIKNLATGNQEIIKRTDLITILTKMLEA